MTFRVHCNSMAHLDPETQQQKLDDPPPDQQQQGRKSYRLTQQIAGERGPAKRCRYKAAIVGLRNAR